MSTMTLGARCIDALQQRGVRYVFGNPGTEFTSLIEAFAAREAAGKTTPLPVIVPHEAVAVNMAYGAYLALGAPQAVMVHASIGAANAATALMNAARMNIPLLFVAGRTPITESGHPGASRDKFIHWAQESFDQGAMFREYVKWDYELREAAQLENALDRAFSIMNTPPKGPVYLQIPRERLLEKVAEPRATLTSQAVPAYLGVPDREQLAQVAQWIKQAQQPLILTKTLGEDHEAVPTLEALAERYALPVITPDAHYYNMSSCHPMFCGYQRNDLYRNADLVLNLGMDVPWCPLDDAPSAAAKIVHIGEDPLFQRIPMRSHRGDLFLVANIKRTLQQLDQRLQGEMDLQTIEARRHAVAHFKRANPVTCNPCTVDAAPVAIAINEIWDDDCILVNELSLPPDPILFDRPGCYFRTGSGSGLGWGLGAALGLAMAQPDKTIIAVVGDGSYYFANPLVIHWLAQRYGLKLLTVILNNGGMRSFQMLTASHFPGGAAQKHANYPLTSLEPAPAFEVLLPTFGGTGYRAELGPELSKKLKSAMADVRHRSSQSLVNIRL